MFVLCGAPLCGALACDAPEGCGRRCSGLHPYDLPSWRGLSVRLEPRGCRDRRQADAGKGCARSSLRIAHALRPCLSARSEEHTSELQSLMRISYAVFCLKKKQNLIKDTYI